MPKSIYPTTLGGRLKWLREARKMTQVQLAAKVGITQASISEIERGRSHAPSAPNLLRLAAALEASPLWLVSGEGDPVTYIASDDKVTAQAAELALIYENLTPEAQAALMAIAKTLKNK